MFPIEFIGRYRQALPTIKQEHNAKCDQECRRSVYSYFALDSCSIVGRPTYIYYRKHKGFKANKSDLKNGQKINPEKKKTFERAREGLHSDTTKFFHKQFLKITEIFRFFIKICAVFGRYLFKKLHSQKFPCFRRIISKGL